MSEQDKKGRAGPKMTGAGKRLNPGIEVVNVYGSGPLPIGERQPEEKGKRPKAKPEQRGALSTSLEGKDQT
jgi:hypothetical protein